MQRAIDGGHVVLVVAVSRMPADIDGTLRPTDIAHADAAGGGWCAVADAAPANAGRRFDDVVARLAEHGAFGVAELTPGDDAAVLIARARWRLRERVRAGLF